MHRTAHAEHEICGLWFNLTLLSLVPLQLIFGYETPLPSSEVGPVWIVGISRPKRQLAELHPWCSAAGAENRRAVVGPQVSGRVATGQSLCPLNAEAKGLLPSAWKGRLKMEIALHRGAQVNILHPCSWMHTVIKWGFSRLPFSFCFSLCYSSHLSSHFLGHM